MGKLKQKLLDVAEILDAYRVVPRIILIAYGYLCYDFYTFIQAVETPSAYQWFGSALFGAASVIAGLYFKSGKDWNEYIKTRRENKKEDDK